MFEEGPEIDSAPSAAPDLVAGEAGDSTPPAAASADVETPSFLLEPASAGASTATGLEPAVAGGPQTAAISTPHPRERTVPAWSWGRVGAELFSWMKTLISAAVYATFIVTFGSRSRGSTV